MRGPRVEANSSSMPLPSRCLNVCPGRLPNVSLQGESGSMFASSPETTSGRRARSRSMMERGVCPSSSGSGLSSHAARTLSKRPRSWCFPSRFKSTLSIQRVEPDFVRDDHDRRRRLWMSCFTRYQYDRLFVTRAFGEGPGQHFSRTTDCSSPSSPRLRQTRIFVIHDRTRRSFVELGIVASEPRVADSFQTRNAGREKSPASIDAVRRSAMMTTRRAIADVPRTKMADIPPHHRESCRTRQASTHDPGENIVNFL
jgi:hypothetical protein